MNLWKECLDLSERGESFVMVTMTGCKGSTPQEPGAKLIVTRKGHYAGTVGGGKVEMAAIKKGQEMLESSTQLPPQTFNWNLQKDIGMSCGGEVTFVFEHFHPTNWPIVIFGAGHIAQALTRVLSKLNCHVTCVDTRAEWIAKLEGVKGIHHPSPKDTVAGFNPKSYFICMTMGHAHDMPILAEIARQAPNCPYVGVVGSDIKGRRIKQELAELGVEKTFIEKLRVPVGLPVGGNQPFEIAISICAELLQVRDQ